MLICGVIELSNVVTVKDYQRSFLSNSHVACDSTIIPVNLSLRSRVAEKVPRRYPLHVGEFDG